MVGKHDYRKTMRACAADQMLTFIESCLPSGVRDELSGVEFQRRKGAILPSGHYQRGSRFALWIIDRIIWTAAVRLS